MLITVPYRRDNERVLLPSISQRHEKFMSREDLGVELQFSCQIFQLWRSLGRLHSNIQV